MRRRRVSLATPSSHERRRQLMNDYQHKSRQTVKMSLNNYGFELLVANLTFCIMSKMVRVHFPWPRRLQALPEFLALCMAWIAAQARSGKFLDTATSASQGDPKPSRLRVGQYFIVFIPILLARVYVPCRDCTKNKTTGSGNESCVWRIHPGYQKESASWTSDERKRNGINVWSMWSVKKFYGLFVDAWNKGNIFSIIP